MCTAPLKLSGGEDGAVLTYTVEGKMLLHALLLKAKNSLSCRKETHSGALDELEHMLAWQSQDQAALILADLPCGPSSVILSRDDVEILRCVYVDALHTGVYSEPSIEILARAVTAELSNC